MTVAHLAALLAANNHPKGREMFGASLDQVAHSMHELGVPAIDKHTIPAIPDRPVAMISESEPYADKQAQAQARP